MNFIEQFNNPDYSDLTLKVGDKSLLLHRIFVFRHCPALATMTERPIVLDHDYDAVVICMRWLYGGIISCTPEHLPKCLKFARAVKSDVIAQEIIRLMSPAQCIVAGLPVDIGCLEKDIISRGFSVAMSPIMDAIQLMVDTNEIKRMIKSIASSRLVTLMVLRAKYLHGSPEYMTLIERGNYSQNDINVTGRIFSGICTMFTTDDAITGELETQIICFAKSL